MGEESKQTHTGRWISVGLVLGALTGLLFGEHCDNLELAGQAYVGLLQMTVLPYLIISLVAKMGRLEMQQARKLGFAALLVLLVLWVVGVMLVVSVSAILPPMEGASFFSPTQIQLAPQPDLLSRFIPANVFRSLSDEVVPAVVVFCLFFGTALIPMPGKEPLLDFLDLCAAGIGRINMFLVRLAPIGLFALTAAAAGSLRLDELARLQAYLLMFTLACGVAVFVVLPLLLSSITTITYRELMRAAHEPMLTVIATGKLFVVLPQIVDKCEALLRHEDGAEATMEESIPSVVVPLAYPFPHLGKILPFVFISFAAWYVGRGLSPAQTTAMAATGAVSSFASPLITMPYLLDQYRLPQDLMPLFILPGFITMRLADVVGLLHLMVLTLIVSRALEGRIRVRWGRVAAGLVTLLACLIVVDGAGRWYLGTTNLEYTLDDQLLSLELPEKYSDVVVYKTRAEAPPRSQARPAIERIKQDRVLRVGYHPDHLPYSFFNQQNHLVGMDVELFHRLAERMNVRLEFVPYDYDTLIEQLNTGEIDVAGGGMIMKPERLLNLGFSRAYQTATMAVLLPDHRRSELENWENYQVVGKLRLAVVHEDLAVAARKRLPNAEIVKIDSFHDFFKQGHDNLDGMIIPAEEGAAWNVLNPDYAIVIPEPIIQRPVSMATRADDDAWLMFLDRWLEFEQMDGSIDRMRVYWVEGGGTKQRAPRWCVMRDILHWIP